MTLCLTGCADLLSRDDYAVYRTPPQRLHEIETQRLTELSRSEPVSIDDAAAKGMGRAAVTSEPGESIELTLAEVRVATLANNLDLKIELVAPSISQETVKEQEARFEPSLFGSVTWSRADQPPSIRDGTGAHSRHTAYETGVRIPLRTGGTATVSVPFSRYHDDTLADSSSGNDLDIFSPSYAAGLKFSISQPLLRGAGVRANTHYIRVAKYERDLVDAQTKLEAIYILARADQAYWALYAARRELDVRQQQYEVALDQLEEAQRRVAAGAAAEIEIMRAESGVSARLVSIIATDTAVRRRERDLKRIMNRDDLPLTAPTSITPVTDPAPVSLDLDAELLAEQAIANRMEMLELELQLAIDESTIDFQRNASLPGLTVDYSYNLSGRAGNYDQAFRDVGDGSYADYAFGLTADVPLGNQAAKARLRRALLQRMQRLASRDQRRLAIRQEVYDALDALEQNWQSILAARQEVVLAGRTFEAEKRQFEVGLRTSTEVLEAAARLASAQSREIYALTAYETSQIHIAVATGTLLGRERVIWAATGLD